MIQLAPQLRILLAVEPADFRRLSPARAQNSSVLNDLTLFVCNRRGFESVLQKRCIPEGAIEVPSGIALFLPHRSSGPHAKWSELWA